MKKFFFIIVFFLIVSCNTINTITLANQEIYCNEEAIIAYDFYQLLYENNVINTKPLIIGKKDYIIPSDSI